MAISHKSNTTYGVRSISFPMRSPPTTHKIEKELNDIKTWVVSSSSSCKSSTEVVCDGLFKLSILYESMDELLNSLSLTQNDKWVEELMDGSIGFLDVCGFMRDIALQIKEHVRDIHCALRSRKGDLSTEHIVARYNCFRKKIKMDVKGLITQLKQFVVAKSDDLQHHHHDVVIRIVKEVREVTIFVFELLLMLFVIPDSRTKKGNKWCMVVSKLIQKKRVACEEHHNQQQHLRSPNDFEGLDGVLLNLRVEDGLSSLPKLFSFARCRLEGIEAKIEKIESGLECMYRRLIRTRASLLNIVSHN